MIDAVFRGPVTFLIGDEECAVRVEADAVGGSKSMCDDLGGGAISADPKQGAMMRDDRRQGVPRRFGIIKISCGIHLQSHGKFMEMRCHLMVVVKVFNKVGLAVAIHVTQPRNLIAAANK